MDFHEGGFDYGANMTDWWEHDVECMVNKDYNHPCVIMYSIGNEIPETGNKFDVQGGNAWQTRSAAWMIPAM